MSRLLPSTSAMPFVTSGTATTPPVPVFVAMPAPSRRNHVSTVKTEAPRPGACPNVTNAFVPPKSIALFDGFESTVIVSGVARRSRAVVRRQLQDVGALDREARGRRSGGRVAERHRSGPADLRPLRRHADTGQAVVGDRAGERRRRRREREDLIGAGLDRGRHVAGAGHDHGDRVAAGELAVVRRQRQDVRPRQVERRRRRRGARRAERRPCRGRSSWSMRSRPADR